MGGMDTCLFLHFTDLRLFYIYFTLMVGMQSTDQQDYYAPCVYWLCADIGGVCAYALRIVCLPSAWPLPQESFKSRVQRARWA